MNSQEEFTRPAPKEIEAEWLKSFDEHILEPYPDLSKDFQEHTKESYKGTWTYEMLRDGFLLAQRKNYHTQKPEGTLQREVQDLIEALRDQEHSLQSQRTDARKINNQMFEKICQLHKELDIALEQNHYLIESYDKCVGKMDEVAFKTYNDIKTDYLRKSEADFILLELPKISDNSHMDPIDTFYLSLVDMLGGPKENHFINPRAVIVNPEDDSRLHACSEKWYTRNLKIGTDPEVSAHMKTLFYGPRTNKEVLVGKMKIDITRVWKERNNEFTKETVIS